MQRDGNQLKAVIGTDYSAHREARVFDQIVVNHGTLPLDALYFDLKPQSANKGAVVQDALIATLDPSPVALDALPQEADTVALTCSFRRVANEEPTFLTGEGDALTQLNGVILTVEAQENGVYTAPGITMTPQ